MSDVQEPSPGSGRLARRWIPWAPLPVILIGSAAFLLGIWNKEDISRQHQNIESAKVIVFGGVLLICWIVFMVWRCRALRWSIVGLFLALIAFFSTVFRIRGVTGDLVPILEWRWKDGRYGHGQMILVGDLILLMAESGELVLIEPTPNERRELSRFSVLRDKTWNPPALAGDLLLVRNDKEAACLRLPVVRLGPQI